MSINKIGRPKKDVSLVQAIKDQLILHPEHKRDIAISLISQARKGSMWAISETINRVDGKPTEKHELSGEAVVKLMFQPIEQARLLEPAIEGEVKVIEPKP